VKSWRVYGASNGQESIMRANKLISALLVAGVFGASVSTNALAGDRRHRDHDDGNNGAIIAAGIIGALVIGSMIANSNSDAPAPVYAQPQPYPEPQPYPPPQVYYQPPPQYYAPQPVYIERGYDGRYGYHRYHDGYYRR
jgi:hypothetical protein